MDDSVLKSPGRVFAFTLRPFKAPLLGMLLLIVVGNAFTYSLPYFLKQIANIALAKEATATFHDFLTPFIIIAAFLILAEACYRVGHLLEVYMSPKIFGRIANSFFAWILAQPAAYFEERLSGELGRRVEQIGADVIFFVETFPWEIGWPIIAILMTIVLLATANVWLVVAFLIWFALFLATSYPLLAWEYRAAERLATAQADLSGLTVDTFGNAAIVQTFAAYESEQAHYSSSVDMAVALERRTRWASLANKAQQGMSAVILGITLTAVSIILFGRHEISIGDFVLIAATIPTFGGIIWTVGDLSVRSLRNYGELKSAIDGLRNDLEPLPEGTAQLHARDGDISFEHLSFTYPSSSIETLSNFNLHIKAGEKVGLVGKSGAGKSTVVKLLLRQYDPQGGSVRIGNEDIRHATLESLRQSITFVPQDTSLFQRTLYENILYAKPEAQKAEVLEAAVRAHADSFIRQYPTGYDTKVGERGVKLSGGQRQRIALARAMLKNAPILVLDEATSALDSESEEIVQKALQELFSGKTVIAIAHRLSTLRAMDRIVVLDNGRIVEDGSPQELLAKPDSLFKDMWERQKGGFVT